jgi:hypothetical protein
VRNATKKFDNDELSYFVAFGIFDESKITIKEKEWFENRIRYSTFACEGLLKTNGLWTMAVCGAFVISPVVK